MHLNGENKNKMGGGGIAGSMQMDRRFVKKLTPGGCLPQLRGYMDRNH